MVSFWQKEITLPILDNNLHGQDPSNRTTRSCIIVLCFPMDLLGKMLPSAFPHHRTRLGRLPTCIASQKDGKPRAVCRLRFVLLDLHRFCCHICPLSCNNAPIKRFYDSFATRHDSRDPWSIRSYPNCLPTTCCTLSTPSILTLVESPFPDPPTVGPHLE